MSDEFQQRSRDAHGCGSNALMPPPPLTTSGFRHLIGSRSSWETAPDSGVSASTINIACASSFGEATHTRLKSPITIETARP